MKQFDQHTIRDKNPDYKPWAYYILKALSIIAHTALIAGAYLLGKFKK